MKITLTFTCLLLILSITMTGCSGYMHGSTKSEARNQYMKVDVTKETFGFQRVNLIINYRGDAIGNFIDEKGYPNYLYEYEKNDEEGDEREGFVFYYLEENKAYDFMEKNWRPDSATLIEIRDFSKFEKTRFGI